MRRDVSISSPRIWLLALASLVVIAILTGCWKKSGEAVVLEKEHIAAREETPTPTPGQAAEPTTPTATPNDSAENEEYKRFEVSENEIVVDTYVMKKEDRGTGRDPRAMKDEQWRVTVQMVQGGRQFNVHTERAQFEKLKVGDRIQVSYREGKYTGTVWGAEIKP
jgi:hypothetical protein